MCGGGLCGQELPGRGRAGPGGGGPGSGTAGSVLGRERELQDEREKGRTEKRGALPIAPIAPRSPRAPSPAAGRGAAPLSAGRRGAPPPSPRLHDFSPAYSFGLELFPDLKLDF